MPTRSYAAYIRTSRAAAAACGVAVALAAATSAAQPAPPATAPTAPASRPAAKWAETLVYQVPPDDSVTDSMAGTDNLHCALVTKSEKSGKFRVVADGVVGPEHEWVAGRSLAVSPDGGRFGYQVQHDNLTYCVIGRCGPKWDAAEEAGHYMTGRILFSPDGGRYAYAVQHDRSGKGMSVVVDGKAWPQQDEVYGAELLFSETGKRFGVRAKTGGKSLYLIDGVAGQPYDAVFGLTFSADGSRYAYTAKVGQQYALVIDGKESARYPIVGGVVFSNDGKRVAYVVEPAGPDGKPGGKQQMVYDDGAGAKAFQPVDGIGTVAFSPPDGRRVAISMQGADKKWQVFVDGKASAKYDAVGGLLFSPDGKRLAALAGTLGPGGAARGSQQFLVVDGKELPPADVIAGAAWSPDGTRVGYIAFVGGQRWLTVDDRRLGPGSFFSFGPDGRHVAHAIPVAGGTSTKAALAIDGEKVAGGEYDAFLLGSRFVWESPKTARVIAGRGHAVYLARVTVE